MTLRITKFIFCFLYWTILSAESKYPVDISYLVSDFKYSQEHGLKICEVQQGSISALTGDRYVTEGRWSILPVIANFFNHFPMKKWIAGVNYMPLKEFFVANQWEFHRSLKILSKNQEFLACATKSPLDSSSIASYAGIVYAAKEVLQNFNFYQSVYPGILFVDAATLPYWIDKYKMNALFDCNEELKGYKAAFELCSKKYDPFLAERIQEKMPSEFYVIKPRKEFLANGVIIIENKNLDNVLQMILEPKSTLSRHPDKNYSYWHRNKDDSFLIEKFYRSDYLHFSHPLSEKADALVLDNGGDFHYDATMRIAFILKYDEGKMTYHCLGGFWKLPSKALEEEGTLNEQRISICKFPFYRAVDPELLKKASVEMEKAMLLLYEIMLNPVSF